ncbi:MAG TPA: hypothetical protein VNJ01_09250 [Bacteriovoracaceae bacterium]|nr:hypothetical protein [Bacteriovoracaceae bacterium]
MKYLLLPTLILISLQSHAGLVGDFSQVHNVPGYIDLSPSSISYTGTTTRTKSYADGVITATPSQLLATFFVNGKIDAAKIEGLVEEIGVLQENARVAFCQSEQGEDQQTQQDCDRGFPSELLQSKWEQESINVAYQYAQKLFREAIDLSPAVSPENINSKTAQPFLEAFFDAFEIYQGVVQESSQVARYGSIGMALKTAQEFVRPVSITADRTEAANLLRPAASATDQNLFFSPEELAQLKDQGSDISLLDPPDSGFWRNPRASINSYDTSRYDGEEIASLKKELSPEQVDALLDPETTISVEYKVVPPKGTGETPKITVKLGSATFKIKFTTDREAVREGPSLINAFDKVMRGGEVYTETAVNNLAAALGFTVDGTYFKNSIKVFFPDEVYEKGQFEAEHQKMLKLLGTRWNAHNNTVSAFTLVKTDPQSGKKYFELRHVQLERKSDPSTDISIGSFIRKGLGKSLKREHRAFSVFLAWVWDMDAKDYNTGLKLVPYTQDGKLRYKVAMSNSDLGLTLASSRPNIFNFKLVKEVKKDAEGNPLLLKFNYLKIYTDDLLAAVSFDDAKWMARLMARLSEKQIYSAFRGAGYPEVIAKYYTGLLLKKRNELLDALNLLGTEFKKSNEFSGSVEGYEEFFHNGVLTDPDNKLWDRTKAPYAPNWGAGVNTSKGEPQEYFLKLIKLRLLTTAGDLAYGSLVSRTGYSSEGLRFQEILMPKADAVAGCTGNCFFQGINYGTEGFIPWRFIVENPDLESKQPFLVVDVFRLGFFVGTGVQSSFGVGIPAEATLGLGANHYQISEFIKVTPVDNIDNLFNEKGELLTMAKLNFKTARATVIRELKANEYLIQSHYFGLKAKAKISPLTGLALPVAPSILFRGDLFTANRVTYFAKDDSKLLVGWDKMKQVAGSAQLNLIDYILKIPVLKAEVKKLSTIQRSFEFDRSSEEDQQVLLSNVNKILPSEIPEKYALSRKDSNIAERSYTMGIFKLLGKNSRRRTISVDYEDLVTGYVASNSTYVKEINRYHVTRRLGFHKSSYRIQASLASNNEIFASVKLDGVFEGVNRGKFKKILKRYTPVLPENFIQFDPDSVLENFGTLNLKIETIIPEKGLSQIFSESNDKFTLCTVYARIHRYDWDEDDCVYLETAEPGLLSGLSKSKRRYLKFWSRYAEVRSVFWDLRESKDESSHSENISKLNEVVSLLSDTGDFDYHSMNLLLELTEKENYYRRASMVSKFEAFPGQTAMISQDTDVEGDFSPSESMKSGNPEDEFTMFSDLMHDTVRRMFYRDFADGRALVAN